MHFRLNKETLTALGFFLSLLISTSVQATAINGLIAYSCRSGDSHQNICLINPDGSGRKQITSGGDNGLPSWSPDGKMIAYTSYTVDPKSGMPMYRIFTMNAYNLSTKFITSGTAPAWSPDGTQIAFTKPSSTSPNTAEIWAMSPNGANQRQLTNAPGSQ